MTNIRGDSTSILAKHIHWLQAVMCFHGSTNGGTISLPSWVLEAGHTNRDIFFADRAKNYNISCLSLGIDEREHFLPL